MFDIIIREAASRFGLGDKAGPLVQMLLAFITNKDTGGLSGFMSKLTNGGMGSMAQSWLGGGAGAQQVNTTQLESMFGGNGGLLSMITSKLGLGGSTVTAALGYILPMVIGKLTPGGTVPTSLSSEVMGFVNSGKGLLSGGAAAVAGGAAAMGSAAGHMADVGVSTGKAAGGGLMKWLPWIAAAIAALFLLNYCSKSGVEEANKVAAAAKASADAAAAKAKEAADATAKAAADAAAAAKATADAAAKAVAEAIPLGSGVIGGMYQGAPSIKVYFDTGKTEVATEFAAKSNDLVAFLKTNASAKAIVSGFNDPTGNAAANAELSKKRAQGVAAALKAAGVADDRVVLEKPADTTAGAAVSNAEARRVEVTIRK
jgi:outer membrane protein OmpA-like peptidoglycan-associated protein/uncharacterized protein YidB (DUF937 family)